MTSSAPRLKVPVLLVTNESSTLSSTRDCTKRSSDESDSVGFTPDGSGFSVESGLTGASARLVTSSTGSVLVICEAEFSVSSEYPRFSTVRGIETVVSAGIAPCWKQPPTQGEKASVNPRLMTLKLRPFKIRFFICPREAMHHYICRS
jgi:hypothetical protein